MSLNSGHTFNDCKLKMLFVLQRLALKLSRFNKQSIKSGFNCLNYTLHPCHAKKSTKSLLFWNYQGIFRDWFFKLTPANHSVAMLQLHEYRWRLRCQPWPTKLITHANSESMHRPNQPLYTKGDEGEEPEEKRYSASYCAMREIGVFIQAAWLSPPPSQHRHTQEIPSTESLLWKYGWKWNDESHPQA